MIYSFFHKQIFPIYSYIMGMMTVSIVYTFLTKGDSFSRIFTDIFLQGWCSGNGK